MMPELALVLYLLYLGLAFGLRSVIQYRRTGHTGFVGLRGSVGSDEWFGGVLFALAVLMGLAAPLLAISGALQPAAGLDVAWVARLGVALVVVGTGATLGAQLAMGDSWRIGVDRAERTTLVTRGVFGVVRNPIFAAMLPVSVGFALLVPNVVALVGCATLLVALEIQTRAVEEPYLRRVHGQVYPTTRRGSDASCRGWDDSARRDRPNGRPAVRFTRAQLPTV